MNQKICTALRFSTKKGGRIPCTRAGDTQEQSAVADTLQDTLPASDSQVEALKGDKDPQAKAKGKKTNEGKKDRKKEKAGKSKAGKSKSRKNMHKVKKEGKRKSAKAKELKEKKELAAAKRASKELTGSVVRNLQGELAAAASPQIAPATAPLPKTAQKVAEQAANEKAPEQAPNVKAPEQAPSQKTPEQALNVKAPEQAPSQKEPEQAPSVKAPEQAPSEEAPEKAPGAASGTNPKVPMKLEPEIGIVYLSNPSWEGALRKLMVGEDFQSCVVKPHKGGRTFYFTNENCVLDKVPERSEFPLCVLRAPAEAKAHTGQVAMQQLQTEPSECDSEEAKKLAEDSKHLEELEALTPQQLTERVNQAVKHPFFPKWITEVIKPENQKDWAAVAMFGQEPATAPEDVCDFELWLKQQQAQQPEPQASTVPGDEVNASEPQQKQKEAKETQDLEEKKQVEANLLRPGTTDLTSPPATPIPQEIPAPSPAEAVPPGEEAAEAEKAALVQKRKKHHATWGRFKRTFESAGPSPKFSSNFAFEKKA